MEATLGIGGIRYDIREFGCVEESESERPIQKNQCLTFDGVPRSSVKAGAGPVPVGENVEWDSCYECEAQYR